MTSLASILSDLEQNQAATLSISSVPTDRRAKNRYPLELYIRFRLLSGRSRFWRAGRTVNLSSGGVLVHLRQTSHDDITAGQRIEISINWPSLLDERVPLQLVARGRVHRLGESFFAATFERHQFRTVSSANSSAGLGGTH